jgi:MFS family permease
MAEVRPIGRSTTAAGFVLGRKLDSIPFSAHHAMIISVLALVGFVEGYDLAITGLLLVMARAPLHLTEADIRWLAVGSTFMICVGGFMASAMSDHWSRKTVMQIGVVSPADLPSRRRSRSPQILKSRSFSNGGMSTPWLPATSFSTEERVDR